MAKRSGVPKPVGDGAGARGDEAAALTFFVTAGERAAVLKRLRRVHRDRRMALLRALGVAETGSGRLGSGK